jgi:hypothetical protein
MRSPCCMCICACTRAFASPQSFNKLTDINEIWRPRQPCNFEFHRQYYQHADASDTNPTCYWASNDTWQYILKKYVIFVYKFYVGCKKMSPASYHGRQGWVPGQFMWDLGRVNWHWEVGLRSFVFPVSVIPPVLHTYSFIHSSATLYNRSNRQRR